MTKTTLGTLALLLAGCGGAASGKVGSADQVAGPRPTEIIHEECDIEASNAERLDANGDGVADVTSVKSGNQLSCQAFDLNFDGKVDSWVYFEPTGQVRRRESDYDRDGRIDEIAIFKGGVLSEKLRATTLNNRLDTWDFFSNGVLARSERDSDGDSVVDQWWEYPKPDCPLIHSDVDGDGRPDPGATIDFCKETGYVPPTRSQPEEAHGADFQKPEDLPTEVDSKPLDEAGNTGDRAPPNPEQPTQAEPRNGEQNKGGQQ